MRLIPEHLIPEVRTAHRLQDYGGGIDEVKVIRLTRFSDDQGSLTELARLDDKGHLHGFTALRLQQLNYSTLEPGVIKAFHVHKGQREAWFVPPEDRILLVLVDVRDASPTARRVMKIVLGDGSSMLLSIPPGVAHGFKNIGTKTARVIYLTDRHFSAEPEKTDEGRLPWDMVGPEIWEPSKD